MALQTIPGGLWIPRLSQASNNQPAYSNNRVIDASAEKFAFVFRVPKTGTLDKFEFKLGAVTFNAASVLRCSFQDVSLTDGNPDGTQDQFRDMTSLSANAWNVPGLITSDGSDTGTKRSVTAGDLLSVVFEFQTFTAADSVVIQTINVSGITSPSGQSYSDLFTASWAKTDANGPVFALKYNDGSYEFIANVIPCSTLNNVTFNNASTPDEQGLIFSLPFPVTVTGVWLRVNASADFDIVLYDSDGSTALATVSVDSDVWAVAASTNAFLRFSPQDLTKDTNYRVVVKPGASNVVVHNFEVASAAIMDAVEGGQNWHYTQRTDAGAWTETTTKRPWMGLLVSAFDDGVSVGGAGGRRGWNII